MIKNGLNKIKQIYKNILQKIEQIIFAPTESLLLNGLRSLLGLIFFIFVLGPLAFLVFMGFMYVFLHSLYLIYILVGEENANGCSLFCIFAIPTIMGLLFMFSIAEKINK